MIRLNKIFYIILTVLQVLLLIGTYVVNYFTRKRMGMLRFVIYKNINWEQTYQIERLQYLAIIIFVALMILVLAIYLKTKSQLSKNILNRNIIMVILIFIYSRFNLLYSTEDFRAFYFMSIMLAVVTFIQIVKVFFSIILFKNNK